INWDTVKRGKHSDIGSTNRQMTEEEKQMVEKAIHHIYEKFIDVVAEGRNMSTDDVHKIAQGRVWTGKQAFERGLVDALGGLDIAVKEMKKLANLKREVELVEFEDKKKGMEISLDMMTKKSDSLNIPDEIRSLLELGDKLLKFGDENILMILPYDLEFK
ncbi:MAG: S49 family peptidase, partial [Candidatus Cloacimonetes bacterium]|nr:S49 family peptidase [Candidatus Cloacimonadota bacterium]